MISLARGLRETLERTALSSGPEEACGLILGTASRLERFRPARNLSRHPKRAFELDPGDLVAAENEARAAFAPNGTRVIFDGTAAQTIENVVANKIVRAGSHHCLGGIRPRASMIGA